jgi:hypothetical protein
MASCFSFHSAPGPRNSAKFREYFVQFRISRNNQIPISWPPWSYIVNEVALALALRYVQVPSRIVYTSPTTLGKTNKLFILDVKPRWAAADVGPLLLMAYWLDKVDLTLPEESRLDMLRSKFEIRPGHLNNNGVAQPAAPAQLVVGRDNPLHIPEVVAQSIRGGTDLYFMRSPCYPGEMLFGEIERRGMQKKEKTASGPKTTSTPKSRGSPAAGRRPDLAAEGRATAGPSGGGDRPLARQLARHVFGSLRLHDILPGQDHQ